MLSIQKTCFSFLLGGLVAGLTMPSAQAITVSGLNTNFGSFTQVGDTSIQTSAYGVTPTEGIGQALLTTASTAQGSEGFSVSGTDAVGAATLETALGLAPGSLTGAQFIEGSALYTTLTLGVGDRVTFDWNFLTSESGSVNGGNVDQAFFILAQLPTGFTSLADATNADLFAGSGALDFNGETGYQNRSVLVNSAGSYLLAFGVLDRINGTGQSGLLVDNINVVPEPVTLIGSLLLGGLGFWQRRKKS